MSDEIDAAPTEDTPTVEGQETTDVNWQKRYEDLRPEFDRTRQTLSRFESDPTAVEEFIRQHHPDMLVDAEDEPEQEDVYTDDDQPEFMTKAEFQSWQKEQATAEAQKQSAQQYETDIKKFTGDRELTQFGRNAIDAAALRGEITTPEQLEKAVNDWFAYVDSLGGTQARKKAPHVVAGGKPNTGTKDVSEMSRAELNQHMVERMHAHESQT
jgi:hypothetical protein